MEDDPYDYVGPPDWLVGLVVLGIAIAVIHNLGQVADDPKMPRAVRFATGALSFWPTWLVLWGIYVLIKNWFIK